MVQVKGLFAVLIGAGVIWLALMSTCPAARQNQVFAAERDLFEDFQIPRDCAAEANPYAAKSIMPYDRCYAPIGYAMARLFPHSSETGGLLFTALGASLFMLSVGLLMEKDRENGWFVIGAVAASCPFLLAVERSNQVWLAAAGALTFLAWFESPSAWKRQLALLALAFAGALKLTPGIFAVLLVKNRRWKDLLVLALEGIALLLLPFLLFDGWNLICEWMANMRLHLEKYAVSKHMGLARLFPSVSFWFAGGCLKGELAAFGRFADMALGIAAVFRCFVCRDRAQETLLLSGALLLLPAVSQAYTYLYFLAPLILLVNRRIPLWEAGLWFALFCPLVIPFRSGALNGSLGNVAFLLLMARAVFMRKSEGLGA